MSDTFQNSLMGLLAGAKPLSTRTPGTLLAPTDEMIFRQWIADQGIKDLDHPASHYDYRGFWKALQEGNPVAVQSASNGHFPDVWKLPGHPTFSNESKYATPLAPHWEGDRLVTNQGKLVVDERSPKVKLGPMMRGK